MTIPTGSFPKIPEHDRQYPSAEWIQANALLLARNGWNFYEQRGYWLAVSRDGLVTLIDPNPNTVVVEALKMTGELR